MEKNQIMFIIAGILTVLTGFLILFAGFSLASVNGGILGYLASTVATTVGIAHIGFAVTFFAAAAFKRKKFLSLVTFFTSIFALVSGAGFFIGPILALFASIGSFFGSFSKKGSKKQ